MKAQVRATKEIVEVFPLPLGGYQARTNDRKSVEIFKDDELDFDLFAEETTIDGYVARDMDGEVRLYFEEPEKGHGFFIGDGQWLPRESFRGVSYNSGPLKVTVTVMAAEPE